MKNVETETPTEDDNLDGAERILQRDNWECQVCGYSPPGDSDVRMFATFTGSDETNPDHFETRCQTHHAEYVSSNTESTKSQSNQTDSQTQESNPPDDPLTRFDRWGEKRFMPQLLAMWPFSIAVIFGLGLIIGGITVLNPLRIFGMGTWPVNLNPNGGAITVQQYLVSIATEATQVILAGAVILAVATQIAIWIEPKNGFVTRLTRWTIQKVKSRL